MNNNVKAKITVDITGVTICISLIATLLFNLFSNCSNESESKISATSITLNVMINFNNIIV